MTKPITPVNDLAEIEKLRKARNAGAVKIKAQGKWFYYGLASTMTNEVEVTYGDGSVKHEPVKAIVQTFTVGNQRMAYGSPRSAKNQRGSHGDHEDCLSFQGGCGDYCPHNGLPAVLPGMSFNAAAMRRAELQL